MPVTGLKCGYHAEVGLTPDHWGPGGCLSVPFAVAQMVMAARASAQGSWGVTSLLGSLKAAAIRKYVDHEVDPADYMAMQMGTAWHRYMEVFDWGGDEPPVWSKVIEGVKVVGIPDRYYDNTIRDYKSGKGPRGSGVWHKDQVQVSLYSELSPFSFNLGIIDYKEGGRECEILSLARCLDFEVDKSGRTLRDNLVIARRIDLAAQGGPAALKFALTRMPCGCKDMMFGKKSGVDYCTVRDACSEL